MEHRGGVPSFAYTFNKNVFFVSQATLGVSKWKVVILSLTATLLQLEQKWVFTSHLNVRQGYQF